MENKVKSLEEGKEAMKNLMGVIPSILYVVIKNLEYIAKVIDHTWTPKPVVDLDLEEETIQTGSGDANPVGGTAKRTRANIKKVVAASAKDPPNFKDNIKELYDISNTLAKALEKFECWKACCLFGAFLGFLRFSASFLWFLFFSVSRSFVV